MCVCGCESHIHIRGLCSGPQSGDTGQQDRRDGPRGMNCPVTRAKHILMQPAGSQCPPFLRRTPRGVDDTAQVMSGLGWEHPAEALARLLLAGLWDWQAFLQPLPAAQLPASAWSASLGLLLHESGPIPQVLHHVHLPQARHGHITSSGRRSRTGSLSGRGRPCPPETEAALTSDPESQPPGHHRLDPEEEMWEQYVPVAPVSDLDAEPLTVQHVAVAED